MATKEKHQFDYVFAAIKSVKNFSGVEIRRPSTEAVAPARRGSRPETLRLPAEIVGTYDLASDEIFLSISGGSGFAPAGRLFNATAPLRVNGGGSADLTADQTWTITLDNTSIVVSGGAVAVGTITAAQHGNQASSGGLHALAVPSGAAGFLSGTFAQDLTNATATASTAGTLVKRGADGEVICSYIQSDAAGDAATIGFVRLRTTETISFRNNANSDNVIALSISGADVVTLGKDAPAIFIGDEPGVGTTPVNIYLNASQAAYFYDEADQRLRIATDANGPAIEFSDELGALGILRTGGSQTLYLETTKLTCSVAGGETITSNDNEVIIGNNVTLARQTDSDAGNYGGGNGVIYIRDCVVAPTSAPTNGVYLFSEGGSLKRWNAGDPAPVAI